MKTKLLTVLSVVALTGFMGVANAADNDTTVFNYNYVEGSYQDIDRDGLDGDAYKISGSYELNPSINILAEYTDGQVDNPLGGSDLDFDRTALGMGYHTALNPSTDFTANVKVVNQNADLIGDDTGFGVGVGIRHMITDKIEVGSKLDYVDVSDIGDTTFNVNSRYHLNEKLSFGLSYSTSSESNDIISGGVRFDF